VEGGVLMLLWHELKCQARAWGDLIYVEFKC